MLLQVQKNSGKVVQEISSKFRPGKSRLIAEKSTKADDVVDRNRAVAVVFQIYLTFFNPLLDRLHQEDK
jgi:hypothetical protein